MAWRISVLRFCKIMMGVKRIEKGLDKRTEQTIETVVTFKNCVYSPDILGSLKI